MIYSGILNRISTDVDNLKKYVGKNIFDKSAIENGKTLRDGTGEVINNASFYVSDFIEVLGGREIYVTNATTTTIVAMYDQYKAYIGQYKGLHTFTLNADAAFIRISNSIAMMPAETQQIEYGSEGTYYEPYRLLSLNELEFRSSDQGVQNEIKQIARILNVSKSLSRNIFNPADPDIVTGYYLKADGSLASLGSGVTTGWVTGYMLVSPNSHYITNLTTGSGSQYMAFYDNEKNLISTATCQSTIKGFDTPANCFFVRFTINRNETVGIKGCQIELGIVSTPVRSFFDDESKEEQEMLACEGNILDVNSASDKWLQGYFDLALVFHKTNNNFKTTDYIRVKGGQYYFLSLIVPSSTHPIIFFDEKKRVIESGANADYVSNNLGFVKVPDNAVYMMFSTTITDKRVVLKNTFYNELGHDEYRWYYGTIQKETDKYVSREFLSPGNLNLLAFFNGLFILRDATNTKLYVGTDLNTIFANRNEITIADLPNIGTGVVTFAHIFQNTRATVSAKAMVYVFIFVTDNSKIYHYTYDTRTAFNPVFTESNVWIGINDSMPQMVSEVVGSNRKLKILPNNDPDGGARLQYFKFLNTNVDLYNSSGYRVFQMGGYTGVSISTGTNKPYEAAPTCLYSTTDGVDFYVTYMFGFSGSRYRMAGGEIVSYPRYRFGEDLDTSAFGTYQGGLKLKVRLNVVPSSADINPATRFEYLQEVDITDATNAAKGVFTLSDASDIQIGDCICISGTASGEWGDLVNSTASSISGGNGIFFMVTSKSGNTITLATCVGNPHNPLFCTHCHAVSPAWNGVILSTGEEYPDSWLVYVDTYLAGYPNYRINSSEKGMSRSCGVVVRPDNKFIYAADTATGVMEDFIGQVSGRTDKLKVSPLGLWKFDMADVDDHSKYTLVHGDIFSVYALRKLTGNILYAAAQGGEALLSFDNGDSFEKICQIYSELALNLGSDHSTTFFMGRQNMNPRLALIVTIK